MSRLLSMLLLFAFSGASMAASPPVPVTVSVPPQAYFVEAIGGDRVQVRSMVAPGQSTHSFSPSPRQLQALEDARIYVKVGHPEYVFEYQFIQMLERRGAGVRVVDMAEDVDFRPLEAHGHDGHHHHHHDDHDGHHGHGDSDPHLWVSPAIVRAAAPRIAEALEAADPEGAPVYRERLNAFLLELDALDAEIRQRLNGLDRRVFLVNHPAWGYFADDYGLQQMAIEVDGKDPSPAQLARFIDRARAESVRVVFVQPGFSRRSAEVIARELDIRLVEMDPMSKDWGATLRALSQALEDALS
ncbi:MAG: zinc ABC transporter substrate-binding protein [Ectothiorhodospiraceae bacterium]|nr:zinc ABC transporter substrate-binding protein [Ectothiorhodospiraceae bacterium]